MSEVTARTTTIENVVSSVSCVELYLQEAVTGLAQLRLILHGAASYGRLDILEWAHQCGYLHTYISAVENGQLAALRWLKDNGGYPFPRNLEEVAAFGGHLNILQWLTADRCLEDTCSSAAEGGHLNILQWARANECLWHENTCHRAAKGGHFNILQWARANEWNAHGMKIRVYLQLLVVISISCSGQKRMNAHGMKIHVTVQLLVVISISCSGPERMNAHGMKIRVPLQLSVDISISCSGQERMDAHGYIGIIMYIE